jgi:hypothetical protein
VIRYRIKNSNETVNNRTTAQSDPGADAKDGTLRTITNAVPPAAMEATKYFQITPITATISS